MKLNCNHRSRAIGETFSRCLVCRCWKFTVGTRWFAADVAMPWEAD